MRLRSLSAVAVIRLTLIPAELSLFCSPQHCLSFCLRNLFVRLSAFTNQREPLEKSAYIFRAHSQLPRHVVVFVFFVLGISMNKKAKMELN